MSETTGEVWESDDCVRRTVVMPIALAERLAARAEQRDLSVSDLLVEYAARRRGRLTAVSAGPPDPGMPLPAAYTKCISAWRGSLSTSWSQVGQYQRASMGVPHAGWRGVSAGSVCPAPQCASRRSAPASSLPSAVSW